MSAFELDVPELRRRLDAQRKERGLSWRGLGEITGISPSAFSRMAGGKCPDADALVTLLVWLNLDADIAYLIKPEEQP